MSQSRRIPGFLHNNGLLLACLGLFAVFFVGMVISGAATYNQEQEEHGSHEQVSVFTYLATGDFVEATFEDWESEFLQRYVRGVDRVLVSEGVVGVEADE
jgi:Domain of unknown function (DUF6766)